MRGTDLVAVARYEGRAGHSSAEIAVVVDDTRQHQGVGRSLLERLVVKGRAELDGPLVRTVGFRPTLDALQQAERTAILAAVEAAGLEGRTDKDLAARMSDVMEARSMLSLTRVLELLNAVVADYPSYAEGWNQRATVYYMLGNYEASLADIEKVLQFEPRHFGALAGRCLIHLAQGKRALAIKDMQEALRYHPFLAEKELFPELQEMTRT